MVDHCQGSAKVPRFPIAAVHAEARTAASIDWRQIAALYTRLPGIQPSAVVELNRAVAIAMRDGPEKGFRLIEDWLELGRLAEARASYEKALALARQEPERRFVAGRQAELKIKIGWAVDFPSARRL